MEIYVYDIAKYGLRFMKALLNQQKISAAHLICIYI